MNFATFAILACVIGTDTCYGPFPSGSIHKVDSLSITKDRKHDGYEACQKAGNAMVEQLDIAWKPVGLEAFIYEPQNACKPQGLDPKWRGKSTPHWGYGA